MKPQLFYHLIDADGAKARRAVIERNLLNQFKFRNLFYEEVRVDLEAHHRASGGSGAPTLPALWDGQTLHEGIDAVLAAIAAIPPGEPPASSE